MHYISERKRSILGFILIFLASLSTPPRAWSESADPHLETDLTTAIYRDVETSTAPLEILNYPLTVVTFDGLITPIALKNSLVFMAKSYWACGIRFKILHIHKFKRPNAVAFDPYSDESAEQKMDDWLAGLPPNLAKPILIYTPVISRAGTLRGFSVPEKNARDNTIVPPRFANTVWINSLLIPSNRLETIVKRIADLKSINYTTEAHELGHLFLRSGHVKGEALSSNIMASGDDLFQGSRFSTQQCDFIRTHPIAK